MSEIRVRAQMKITNGQVAEYRDAAKKLVDATVEKDNRTLGYACFVNEEDDSAVMTEYYADSDAMLEHMDNTGHLFIRIFELCEVEAIEVYGEPSPKLMEALSGFDGAKPVIYSPVAAMA